MSKNSIVELVDIGSNLSFITFASSVSKIKCIDIRPHKIILENVDFAIGNITNLPFENESINNISSLSVIEHIGLEDMVTKSIYLEWKNLQWNLLVF